MSQETPSPAEAEIATQLHKSSAESHSSPSTLDLPPPGSPAFPGFSVHSGAPSQAGSHNTEEIIIPASQARFRTRVIRIKGFSQGATMRTDTPRPTRAGAVVTVEEME